MMRHKILWSSLLLVAAVGCTTTNAEPNQTADRATKQSAADETVPAVQCSPNDDGGTVTIWHSMGGQASVDLWESFEEEFESTHAIDLEVKSFGGDSGVLDALRTTNRSDWPDLIDVSEQDTRVLLDTEQFLPPSACDPSVGSDLLPLVRATYTVDDQLVALPFGVSVPVLVFDAAEFRAAGLDPAKPPATLAELMDSSATLVTTGASTFGLVASDGCANLVLSQFSAKRGVPEGAPDNGRTAREFTVDYATPANIADLTALANGVIEGHVKYIGGTESTLDDLLAIADPVNGAAMTVHTSGALVDVIRVLKSNTNFPGVELGVGPLPGPGIGSLVGGNAFWLTSSDDAGRVGRAWTVLQWLYAPERLAHLAAETGYVPATAGAAQDPALLEQWRQYPQLKVAYDQVLATPVNAATSGPLFGPFDARAHVLFNACDRILADGADVAAVLSDATEAVNELLVQYEQQRTGTAPPIPEQSAPPLPPPAAVSISGTVECESGGDIVGVWVQPELVPELNKGYADFVRTGPGTADWAFTLKYGGRYQLHVGCGGTPQTWGSSSFTSFESGPHDFLCHDDPPRRGECETL